MSTTIILHGADTRPSVPDHDEESTTNLTGLTGYTSFILQVTHINRASKFDDSQATIYIDGELKGISRRRHIFHIVVYPMRFSTATWGASQEENLGAVLDKKYKWIEVTAFATALDADISYHTSGKAIPVDLTSYSHQDGRGQKRIDFELSKVWR